MKNKHVLHGVLTAQREQGKNDPIIKAATVLETSKSYSRAGKMSESLLTGKDALLTSSNTIKNNHKAKGKKNEDVRLGGDVAGEVLSQSFSVNRPQSSNFSPSNTSRSISYFLEDDSSDSDNKKQRKADGAYYFKTVPRDESSFRHFLGSNGVNYNIMMENKRSNHPNQEMPFQNLGPGHYRPRFHIVDPNPRPHTFLPQGKHKRREIPQTEEEKSSDTLKDSSSIEWPPFAQDHYRFSDKNRGPTSMFKSTSTNRELPKKPTVDEFYDSDITKVHHPRPIIIANLNKDITREQASRSGRVGANIAPDSYYDKKLNLDVTQPTLGKGMTFDQTGITREKQRKAARHNIEMFDYDVANNPKVHNPNWSHFYDVDKALLERNFGDSSHKSRPTMIIMDKQRERTDLYGLKEDVKAGNADNSDNMFLSAGVLSTNQAYDKTHPKLQFMAYFDKYKKRPEYLYKIPEHNNLQYDVDLSQTMPHPITATIMPESTVTSAYKGSKTDYYDKRYSVTQERSRSTDFSRSSERNALITTKLMRNHITPLDKFYEASRGLDYLQPRLKGDPMIKTQKGRQDLYQTNRKKKKKKSNTQRRIDEYTARPNTL